MVLLGASALLSAIVDNIPYVATIAPIVAQLTDSMSSGAADPTVLWWALALGAGLGGNATAIGAAANIVVTGFSKRNGYPISFGEFTKYGLIITSVTTAMCVPYLWLRYFTFA